MNHIDPPMLEDYFRSLEQRARMGAIRETKERAACEECGKDVKVSVRGTLYAHANGDGYPCTGSGARA